MNAQQLPGWAQDLILATLVKEAARVEYSAAADALPVEGPWASAPEAHARYVDSFCALQDARHEYDLALEQAIEGFRTQEERPVASRYALIDWLDNVARMPGASTTAGMLASDLRSQL